MLLERENLWAPAATLLVLFVCVASAAAQPVRASTSPFTTCDDGEHPARVIAVAADRSATIDAGLVEGFTGGVELRVRERYGHIRHDVIVLETRDHEARLRMRRPTASFHVGDVVSIAGQGDCLDKCMSERPEGLWEIAISTLVGLDVNQSQVGAIVLGGARVLEHGPGPLFVRADLGPVGIAAGTTPMFTGASTLTLGLETSSFWLGVGGGVMTPNGYGGRNDRTWVPVIDADIGFAFPSVLQFDVRASVGIADAAVQLGSLDVALSLLMDPDVHFEARMSLSMAGAISALFDFGWLVAGDGRAPGSVYLDTNAGIAGVFYQPGCAYGACSQTPLAIGPALGVGLTMNALP